jgi:putative SOS response-associated peptidase YedK
MCSLYTTNQAVIIAFLHVINRCVGNLAPMPGVFTDYPTAVIGNAEAGPEMTLMGWGMSPPEIAAAAGHKHPIPNRHIGRGWLKPEDRCLAPTNSFAECVPSPNPERRNRTPCGSRSTMTDRCLPSRASGRHSTVIVASKPVPQPHLVYGFLTTSPNAVVEPNHPKAMPVILTSDGERDVWMRAVG